VRYFLYKFREYYNQETLNDPRERIASLWVERDTNGDTGTVFGLPYYENSQQPVCARSAQVVDRITIGRVEIVRLNGRQRILHTQVDARRAENAQYLQQLGRCIRLEKSRICGGGRDGRRTHYSRFRMDERRLI